MLCYLISVGYLFFLSFSVAVVYFSFEIFASYVLYIRIDSNYTPTPGTYWIDMLAENLHTKLDVRTKHFESKHGAYRKMMNGVNVNRDFGMNASIIIESSPTWSIVIRCIHYSLQMSLCGRVRGGQNYIGTFCYHLWYTPYSWMFVHNIRVWIAPKRCVHYWCLSFSSELAIYCHLGHWLLHTRINCLESGNMNMHALSCIA